MIDSRRNVTRNIVRARGRVREERNRLRREGQRN
jgi:hypothetical protein